MKNQKSSFHKTERLILIIGITLAIIMIGDFVILQVYNHKKLQYTKRQIVKASYTDREIYIDLKTLEPVKQGSHEIGDILRIEFPHIKDTNNNYMQLQGKYPEEFADRVDMVKTLAILKGIVTAKELTLLKPSTRETAGNITTIKYEKTN